MGIGKSFLFLLLMQKMFLNSKLRVQNPAAILDLHVIVSHHQALHIDSIINTFKVHFKKRNISRLLLHLVVNY